MSACDARQSWPTSCDPAVPSTHVHSLCSQMEPLPPTTRFGMQAYDHSRSSTATPMQSPPDINMATPGSASHRAEADETGCGLGANIDVLVCRAEWYYHVGAYQVAEVLLTGLQFTGAPADYTCAEHLVPVLSLSLHPCCCFAPHPDASDSFSLARK